MIDKSAEESQVENIFLEDNFKGMRTIQKNRLDSALENFHERIDSKEYLKLVQITRETLGIDISLRKVILVAYGDPFLHSNIIKHGADESKSEWLNALSMSYLNREFPTFGDNLNEDEYKKYLESLERSINK